MITLSGTGFSNKAFVHQNTTGSYGADNYDALKFGYGSFQIATFEPGTNRKLDINNLPVYGAKTTDTIEVEVNVPAAASNYQLSFSDVNTFNSNLKVYLQDKLLNTIQDLSTANTYSFATNGTAGSTGNRFRVLITNQTNPLPVVFTALEAQLNNNTTDLKWSTLSEKNNAKFVVERSVDMVTFNEIGLVKAVGNSNVRNNYTFADAKPEAYTTNYYRIKQVDVNGKFSYSNIASITTDVKGNGINSSEEMNTIAKVFPVPTKDILNIEQLDGTTLSYSIVDVFGSEVLNGTTEITEAGSVINVSALSNGIYFLVAKTDNGQSTKTRFIVE
ncbi:MAG: T9SS type A sorting domain-containing protein [Bacteroidia bacterium]